MKRRTLTESWTFGRPEKIRLGGLAGASRYDAQ